ncbi:MAG TPA: hypothetical protein DCR35_03635 [Runella sp.]|nr:hypothetical protein [Runella sp.]HAO48455.1 hypothetical protein [Runella sp.]
MNVRYSIVIEKAKITDYLLVWKEKNDKSVFLNHLGYYQNNWEDLQNDILNIVQNNEAIFQRNAPFGGTLHKVTGELKDKRVVTIWLLADDNSIFRFVTLYPEKH